MTFNDFYPKVICWCLALVPALLLTTNNYSVAIIALAVVLSLIYLQVNKTQFPWTKFDTLAAICFSCYLIGAIPIAIADGSTARYFQGGIRLFLCLPIYLALRRALIQQDLRLRPFLENGVVIGSIGTFILACYQYFYLNMPRVDGFLFSINFGYLACSLGFLSFTLILGSKNKILLGFAFALSIFSVSLTLTRGAIFAIPLILVVISMLNIRHISLAKVLAVISIFVLASVLMYQHSTGFQKRIDYTVQEFKSIQQGQINKATSSGFRIQYWLAAVEAFKQNPLYGLSYKQREELNEQLYISGKIGKRASGVQRGHAHSQYFEMLASNGILGLISLFAIFVIPFYVLANHYLVTQSPWALTGCTFVAGFSIFGLTEVPLTANAIGSFYGFMLAVFFAIIATEKQNKTVL